MIKDILLFLKINFYSKAWRRKNKLVNMKLYLQKKKVYSKIVFKSFLFQFPRKKKPHTCHITDAY